MKNSIKLSAYMLTIVLALSACTACATTAEKSDVTAESSYTAAEISEQYDNSANEAQESTGKENNSEQSDESTGSDEESKAEQQTSADDTEKSSAQSAEQESTVSDTGAGEITLSTANESNTKLSSGSYEVQIGNKTVTLSGAYVVDGIEAVIEGGEWNSSSTDQNVFLVMNGGSLTLKNAALTKTGDAGANDSTRKSDVSDDYNFYGINSVILVVGEGSRATVENCTINSDCSGANAVFSLDNANIDVSNVRITTTGNSSRGVYATYGGTITADHIDIKTSGAHCAPVATDRGGGYVTVRNSRFDSSGDGSPNIYSTGEITVENCEGVSTGSQAAVIEGRNSITMINCRFSVSGSGNNGIMLYQSMSGDAADSDATANVSTLTMTGTTIDCELDGPMFYITNTNSVINLNGGNSLNAKSENLVSAAEGRWGREGSNGGTLTLNISGESISDSITADDISTVTVNLSDGAEFTGSTSGSVSAG